MGNVAGSASAKAFEASLDFVLKSPMLCVDNLENVRRGESFMGISRMANPEWPGWFILDEAEKGSGRKERRPDVATGDVLRGLVRCFYRDNFWRGVYADTMPEPLATVLFDCAVVHGRNRAFRFLQEALNTVSGVGRLEVDGIFRKDSQQALRAILAMHMWYRQVLVAEVIRARQAYCDVIACGDRSGCCRARLLEVQGFVEGYFEQGLLVIPCGKKGRGTPF